jgi:Nucleotidyltransferase of unknown function (DUF6036)
MIEDFIRDLDAAWSSQPNATALRLNILGSAALLLRAGLRRGTKDSDVLEVDLTPSNKETLLAIAGRGTRLSRRHRLYLDIVPQGLPFLPQTPCWHALTALNADLRHLAIHVLDVVDVVVSKLQRFSANDRSDIDEMVVAGLVPHRQLVERFEAAIDWHAYDARAAQLPDIIENLHAVERDALGVEETPIELPVWLSE